MRARILFFLMLLMPLTAFAGDGDAEKKQPLIVKGVMWLKTLIDSMAVATVDRSYIEQPKKAWAVELRTEATESMLKMNTRFPTETGTGLMSIETTNGFTTGVGAWLGYRGYGFGYTKGLTGGNGSAFSFGAMGGSFGINFRINNYHSDMPDIRLKFSSRERSFDERDKEELVDPIRVRSLFLDGYYMFNGKHFSYAAAYDQSLIQRRSAGSLMAGVMYNYARASLDDESNIPLVAFMRGVGKFKFTQASVGVGYAYNWVPAKGWLVSVQAMPMLQFYNRLKAYTYAITIDGFDITQLIEADFEDFIFDSEEDYDDYADDEDDLEIKMEENGVQVTNNYIGWNFDARLAVVYNWKDFYLRVYGHYNRFRYSNDMGDGHMAEWHAYASLGFRF